MTPTVANPLPNVRECRSGTLVSKATAAYLQSGSPLVVHGAVATSSRPRNHDGLEHLSAKSMPCLLPTAPANGKDYGNAVLWQHQALPGNEHFLSFPCTLSMALASPVQASL
eukprot:4665368-Amphidinium_carterae.2